MTDVQRGIVLVIENGLERSSFEVVEHIELWLSDSPVRKCDFMTVFKLQTIMMTMEIKKKDLELHQRENNTK